VCRPTDPYCDDGYCDTGEDYTSCSDDCTKPYTDAQELEIIMPEEVTEGEPFTAIVKDNDGNLVGGADVEYNGAVKKTDAKGEVQFTAAKEILPVKASKTGYKSDSVSAVSKIEGTEEETPPHGTAKTTCSSDADCEKGEVCRDGECIEEPFYQPIMPYISYIAAFLAIIVLIASLWLVIKRLRKPKEVVLEPTLAALEKKSVSAETAEKSVSKAKGKIFCRNLVKSYKNTKVLKSVSVEFEEGKIYGIVGPSGCGKSRLVECLIGRITPDSGDASVFGYDPRINMKEINEVVGFVPQHPELYPEQTVWHNMQNSAIKWGIANFEKVCSDILKSVDLVDRRDVVAKNLSGGQIKRLSLAMELIRDPRVLLLDEPTTGLDPGMRTKIMTILDNLNKKGKTIIFSTHYMDEIDICDEVLIMKNGELIIKSTVEGLRRKTPGRGRVVEVTLERVGKSLVMELEKDRGVHKVIESGRILRIFTHEPNVTEIGNKVTKLGGVIEASRITQADMRDLFIYLTDTYPEEEQK